MFPSNDNHKRSISILCQGIINLFLKIFLCHSPIISQVKMNKHGMMITNDNLLHILLLSFFNMYMLLLTMTHKCCFLHPSINNTSYKWCIPWSITIPILFSPSSAPCYLNSKLNMSINIVELHCLDLKSIIKLMSWHNTSMTLCLIVDKNFNHMKIQFWHILESFDFHHL